VALIVALALPAASGAQQRAWFTSDNSPPGTPAQVVFDANASSASVSFFDVFIHGFYYQTRTSPTGQPFTQLMFPGLSRFGAGGEPDLPAVQVRLAMPPGANLVTLDLVDPLGSATFLPPSPVWPVPISETDTTAGQPEQFVPPNPNIYGSSLPWPPNNGDGRKEAKRLGPVPGADVRLYPVHWKPTSNQLEVMTHVRYQLTHTGQGSTLQELTKDDFVLAQNSFRNWGYIQTYYPPNRNKWNGNYLIVTESKYALALQPLAIQKAARGYAVTVHLLAVGEIGNATAIRSVVQAWYAGTSPWYAHYALLVGDNAVIPCGTHSSIPTDDLYADVDGDGTDDLVDEVYVGRLSADGLADVQNQVGKWLDYESHPHNFFNYGRDLLVGNKQDAPGKYVGCLESVAAYGAYTVAPAFTKLYGNVPGVDNTDLSAAVNSNYGLVTYRGHGDWDEWWNWDLPSENYYSSHVDALTNSIAPVVWSIACTTADIEHEDCFGEHWMERPDPNGAVAFYGATRASDTDPNHVLTRALHRNVFQYGITKHGPATAYAETVVDDSTSTLNSWRYLLLGDPDLDVRRRAVIGLTVLKPTIVTLGTTSVRIQVTNPQGQPIPSALVAAYKPAGAVSQLAPTADGFSTDASEMFDNQYTGTDGWATVNGNLTTDGWLYYGVRLDEGPGQGEALLDSIPVGHPNAVEPGLATANRLAAFPSVTSRGTRFSLLAPLERDAAVVISDVAGREIRELPLSRGAQSVDWDGRGSDGSVVGSGMYFARITGFPAALRVRLVVIR
jgi:hypothetical protein